MSLVLPGAFALAAVSLCTWVSFRLGQSSAFAGFLYLVFVVLTALYGGLRQATVVSIAAAACLNYYFVPPIFSFANSPANWAALGAFEFTALVISRLSQRARLQAMDAQDGRRDMERLYETSRRILLLDSTGEPGPRITSLIREIFDLEAVQLFDPQSGNIYKSGRDVPEAEPQTRDAYFMAADRFDSPTRSWFCLLRLGTRPVGSLALIGTEMSKLAATALARSPPSRWNGRGLCKGKHGRRRRGKPSGCAPPCWTHWRTNSKRPSRWRGPRVRDFWP